MKIKRYPHSCILIEIKNKKILIDPGEIKFKKSYIDETKDVDYIFITHKHNDHCNRNWIKKLNSKLYSTEEVKEEYPEFKWNVISLGDNLDFEDFSVEVVHSVHGYIPPMKNYDILENIGYIISDNKTRIYIPGDTICFDNDYKADIVFVPVCGHGITMGPFEAAMFAANANAKLTIPYHYDNEMFQVSLTEIEKYFKNINHKIMEIGSKLVLE